jgi:hypothetical protein
MDTPNGLFRLPRKQQSPIAAINKEKRARRAEQIRLVGEWLRKKPKIEPVEIQERFASVGIELQLETVRDYIYAARQLGRKHENLRKRET